ncbi:MAG: hypothetical protein ACLRXA_23990 [Clostridium sp.]
MGKDLASLLSMTVHVTLAMEDRVMRISINGGRLYVSDSICIWESCMREAWDPYVCSTTTFAFNRYTAKLMNRSRGLVPHDDRYREIKERMKELRQHGYGVDKFTN